MQIEKYKQRARHNIKEGTLRSRMSALNNLQEFVGDTDELEVSDVEDWIDHLITEYEAENVSAGTIKQYYRSVKYYWKTINGDAEPIEHIRDWIPVGETNHGDYLERDEWDRLREVTTSLREQAIIDLMYYYARRPTEIILLNMDDIDFRGGEITFNIVKKKEPFRATFNLKEQARESLEAYLNYRTEQTIPAEYAWEEGEIEPVFTTTHGRISYDTVWKSIKELADKAGIDKNITPKSMRHSRTTHLDRAGNSPDVIARQQLLHDPESDVVGHYVHPRDETDTREVMELDDE